MNRITLHNFDYGYFVMEGDCQLETVKSTAEGCNLDLFSGNAVDCLAAYEDTNLSPPAITALQAEAERLRAALKATITELEAMAGVCGMAGLTVARERVRATYEAARAALERGKEGEHGGVD